MSRFLQRLAARSLEALPVLQPRRASRFEPTESSGVSEAAVETESTPVRPPEVSVVSQAMVPPPLKAAAPEAAGPPRTRDSDTRKPLTPALPEPVRDRSPLEPPSLLEEAPLLAAPAPTLQLPIRVPAPAPEPWRSPVGPVQPAPPLLAESARVPALTPPPQAQHRTTGQAPALLVPMERREDIHISIGRIEIRALPAKAAPAPRKGPADKPSPLDTYLQQRGSRRTP